MVKILVFFGLGVYTGMYICQNYNVPRVNNPEAIWENVKEFIDKHKKD